MLLYSLTMKILSWNVRGINASNKQAQIKHQLDACGDDIIPLQESKMS